MSILQTSFKRSRSSPLRDGDQGQAQRGWSLTFRGSDRWMTGGGIFPTSSQCASLFAPTLIPSTGVMNLNFLNASVLTTECSIQDDLGVRQLEGTGRLVALAPP
ncbi:hypothetical protein K2Y11_23975 [bacterium]|nr:hypothetical protein [bacterium]